MIVDQLWAFVVDVSEEEIEFFFFFEGLVFLFDFVKHFYFGGVGVRV